MFHLIDSDAMVLDVTREIMISAGFESLTFDSPAAYLEYLNSAAFVAPMAMLTSYLLPGMNGYALVKEVRKKHPLLKAMIISGSSTVDISPDAESLLCLHLSKPYQAETLIAALKVLNLCDQTCAKRHAGSMSTQYCKFGLQHACPFYIGSGE